MEKQIALLKNLVSIPSVSGCERQAVDFLVNESKKLYFDTIKKDRAGNFIGIRGNGPASVRRNVGRYGAGPEPEPSARYGAGTKQILLVGHIDTVEGYIPVKIKNNKLYGRGAVDAKASLAAFIWAAQSIKDIGDTQIIVIGAVEEEGSSRGAKYILDKYKPDYIIVGEPSGWENITIGYKGGFRFDYIHKRKLTHYASKQASIGMEAITFINVLNTYLRNTKTSHTSIFHSPQLEVRSFNTISDGISEEVVVALNIRIPPEFDIQKLEKFLKPYPIYIKEKILPNVAEKNNDLVRSFLRAIRKNAGNPKFLKKTGTSDFNIFAHYWKNIPIVVYGPGNSKLDHTPHEHIDLDEYIKSINILSNVLTELN